MKKLLILGALSCSVFMNLNAATSFFCGAGLGFDTSKLDSIYLNDESRHSENLNLIGGILFLGSWIDINSTLWRFGGRANVFLTGSEGSTFNLGGHEVKTDTNGVSPGFDFMIGHVVGNGNIMYISLGIQYKKSKLEAKIAPNDVEKVTNSQTCPSIGLGFERPVNFSKKMNWGANVNYAFSRNTKGTNYKISKKGSVGFKIFLSWHSL